eukprot:9059069-Alexandrium_andersonii.AAC.1
MHQAHPCAAVPKWLRLKPFWLKALASKAREAPVWVLRLEQVPSRATPTCSPKASRLSSAKASDCLCLLRPRLLSAHWAVGGHGLPRRRDAPQEILRGPGPARARLDLQRA